ncbi:MAG: uroporphyrinogen-III synthase [Alphaproteobacteria bacterium]|nr:uroporphyrinogen-III synthase [Alphaproteobacteria bacterium]
MRFLITRPHEDAAPLANALQAMGHETLIAPLMTIKQTEVWKFDSIPDCQAIAISSANGARALMTSLKEWPPPHRDWLQTLPIFCVGDATAEILAPLNLRRLYNAKGHGGDLAHLIAAQLHPDDGGIEYLCGRVTTENFAQNLSQAGFDLRAQPLYDAVAATHLPLVLRQFLHEAVVQKCDKMPASSGAEKISGAAASAVLMFSTRSLQIFEELIEQENSTNLVTDLDLYCLSPTIAATARLSYRNIFCAARPNQAAMIELIKGNAESI